MKKETPRKKIVRLIRAGKARMMGDVTLLNQKEDGKIVIEGIEPRTSMKSHGFAIRWSAKGVGFGEITLIPGRGGLNIRLWTESMSATWTKKVLSKMIDEAIWEEESR